MTMQTDAAEKICDALRIYLTEQKLPIQAVGKGKSKLFVYTDRRLTTKEREKVPPVFQGSIVEVKKAKAQPAANEGLDGKTLRSTEGTVAIPCAFINAHSKAKKLGAWLAFRVVETSHDELALRGTREYTYDHPEAPGSATISVLREEEILRVKTSDLEYGVLYGLLQAENAAYFLMKQKRV